MPSQLAAAPGLFHVIMIYCYYFLLLCTLQEKIYAPDQITELMSVSDYVVASTPYTPATDKLVSAAAIAAMKPNGVFINVGRGKCVDEEALIDGEQLKRGNCMIRCGACGADLSAVCWVSLQATGCFGAAADVEMCYQETQELRWRLGYVIKALRAWLQEPAVVPDIQQQF